MKRFQTFIQLFVIGASLWAIPAGASVNVSTHSAVQQALGLSLPEGTFQIDANSLTFGREDLEFFAGGSLSAPPFFLTAIPGTQDLWLFDQLSGLEFRIRNPHIGTYNGMLHLLHGDIMANASTMNSSLFSNVEEIAVGEIAFSYPFPLEEAAPPGALPFCPTNFGPDIDVELSGIYTVQQIEREPNVRLSISMATLLTNIGSNDVIWLWSINPPGPYHPLIGQHPYAVFHLYKHKNGVFQQIGKSDVKHAFYSANTGCACPGAQVIFSGCQDLYGVGNNANPFYFGPRDEVNIFNGTWESFGSHFDVTPNNLPPDDLRDPYTETNVFEHMLVVSEPRIYDNTAEYYVESWYAVQGDTNNYNNIGYRKVIPLWTNGLWAFIFDSAMTNGPAIDRFVAPGTATALQHHRALDTQEGMIHLAADVEPLGGGTYRYGYALLNLSFDRRLDAFSVPLSDHASITNVVFGDSDVDGSNDWTMSITNGTMRWTCADTNGLIWGSLLSFTFEADIPPSPSLASVSALMPGPTNEFTVSSLVPDLRISAISGDQSAQITWPAVSGSVYRVEASSGSTPTTWTNTGMIVTGTTAGASLIDSNVTDGTKLYRLQLLSAP